MIRIRYTFTNANGVVSWSDSLTSAVTPEKALQTFAKTATKFVLQNLIDLRMFSINPKDYNPQEVLMQGCEQLIIDFIADNK